MGACEQLNTRMKERTRKERLIREHGEVDEYRGVVGAGELAFAAYVPSR